MNKYILLLTIALLPVVLFSQKNFVPAYVISLQGDTINGLIDDRNWDKNPTKITFKKSEQATEVRHDVMSIRGFAVGDEYYKQAILQVENSPRQVGRLAEDADLNLKQDTVFLRYLIAGTKSLLVHKSKAGTNNYYIPKADTFALLQYKRFIRNKLGIKKEAKRKDYIVQLKNYLVDCEAVQSDILNLEYETPALLKVFERYYAHCATEESLTQLKKEKAKVQWGIVAGLTVTDLFSNSDFDVFYRVTQADYTPSLDYVVGIRLDIFLPRVRNKISVNNELLFTRFLASGVHEDIVSDNERRVTNTKIGFSQLKMNNLFKYRHLLKQEGNIFFNLGISNTLTLKELANISTEQRVFFGIDRTRTYRSIEQTRPYQIGGVVGVGVQRGNLLVDIRYEVTDGFSFVQLLRLGTSRGYFLISYEF
ncbi:MAG: outer membrane beta-barrel protein [Bacteroidota bacterium]